MTELLPCPFCGGEAAAEYHKSYARIMSYWSCLCKDCGSESGWYDTEAEAIAAWNTRAVPGELVTIMDGEEIVRCRDCENARVQPWNAITRTGLWCVEHDIPIDVDGFCAWGVREDGDAR